jgi:hypothetical protein
MYVLHKADQTGWNWEIIQSYGDSFCETTNVAACDDTVFIVVTAQASSLLLKMDSTIYPKTTTAMNSDSKWYIKDELSAETLTSCDAGPGDRRRSISLMSSPQKQKDLMVEAEDTVHKGRNVLQSASISAHIAANSAGSSEEAVYLWDRNYTYCDSSESNLMDDDYATYVVADMDIQFTFDTQRVVSAVRILTTDAPLTSMTIKYGSSPTTVTGITVSEKYGSVNAATFEFSVSVTAQYWYLQPTDTGANVLEVSFYVAATEDHSVYYDRDLVRWCVWQPERACIKSIASNPLAIDNLESSSAFAIVPLTNFDGNFEAQGVAESKAMTPRLPPPVVKPEMAEFSATTLEYAEECQDEMYPASVHYDHTKMNEFGLSLPKANPCRWVAGKWETGALGEFLGTDTGKQHMLFDDAYGSAWIKGGLMGVGKKQAGYSFKKIAGEGNCGSRADNREDEDFYWKIGYENVARVAKMYDEFHKSGCDALPATVATGAGIGPKFEFPKTVCKAPAVFGAFVRDSALELINQRFKLVQRERMLNDCNTLQAFRARAFCDMHCIRDAVRVGTETTLQSLEQAVSVFQENMDKLIQYHTEVIQREFTILKQDTQTKLQEQLVDAESSLAQIIGEIQATLASSLDAAGRTTAVRALDAFVGRFARRDVLDAANASKLLEDMSSEATMLLHTVRVASTNVRPAAGAVALHTIAASQEVSTILLKQDYKLGVYQASAILKKTRQESMSLASGGSVAALRDEIQMAETEALLRDIDRSWWIIREQLDAYLEAAAWQTSSALDTIAVLRNYTTKCNANFFQLRSAESRAAQADEVAKRQLHDTWHTVVHEFGLLAARIVDSGAFQQFDRFDVASQDFGDNRSALCGFGKAALATGFSLVQTALKAGLAQQTWMQIEGIIVEAKMLESRLLMEGLQAQGKETLVQALQRITISFQEALAPRKDLVAEVAVRTCSSKQSLLEVRRGAVGNDTTGIEPSRMKNVEAQMHVLLGSVAIVMVLVSLLMFIASRT